MRKWLCKIFGHKWHLDGIINNGLKDGLNHGFCNWSCIRCKAMYSEGFNYNPIVSDADVLHMIKTGNTQPWISKEQERLIHYE